MSIGISRRQIVSSRQDTIINSVHTAPDDNDDATIAISQLVHYQDKYVLPSGNRYRYSTTPIDLMYQVHDDDDDDTATNNTATINTATTDTATTTLQRPLSSTVPNSASGYSTTTTIVGELILLCRLTY
jgi:hypothetical protein